MRLLLPIAPKNHSVRKTVSITSNSRGRKLSRMVLVPATRLYGIARSPMVNAPKNIISTSKKSGRYGICADVLGIFKARIPPRAISKKR